MHCRSWAAGAPVALTGIFHVHFDIWACSASAGLHGFEALKKYFEAEVLEHRMEVLALHLLPVFHLVGVGLLDSP